MSSGSEKTDIQSTVKGKREEVDRRRSGKTILMSWQKWALLAQLGQLKTGRGGKDCCEVIYDAPTTSQGYWMR